MLKQMTRCEQEVDKSEQEVDKSENRLITKQLFIVFTQQSRSNLSCKTVKVTKMKNLMTTEKTKDGLMR